MSEPPATPASASASAPPSTVDELLTQLALTIQCLDDAVPAAAPDDPVYRSFLKPLPHAEPLAWPSLEYGLQAVAGRPGHSPPNLKRGPFGLQAVVPFLQHARSHPSWAAADELLEPIVETILQRVIDRCTQPQDETPSQPPIAVPEARPFATPALQDVLSSTMDPASPPIPAPIPVCTLESSPPRQARKPALAAVTEALENKTAIIDVSCTKTPPSMTNKTTSRKRNSTTVAHKIQVIEHHNREGSTQKQTAKQFGLTQSQLSRWLKEEDELREYVMDKGTSSKRQRTGDFPQIEETLLRYFVEAKSRNVAVTDDNLKDRTKAFMKLYQVPDDALKVSNGWLLRFKGRNNIKSYVRPAPPVYIESRIGTVREQLRMVTDSFALRDIYVADEVALFCNLSPLTGSLCVNAADRVKLTYLLCSNADGSDKRTPLAVGSSPDPASYKDAIGDQAHAYRYTSRGWMTGPVFAEWLKKFDREMARHARHVLLLIDNSPAHVYDGDSLLNTRVHFLPSNHAIQTQPLAAGVIQTFKSNYRRNLIESFVTSLDMSPESALLPTPDEQVVALSCGQRAWDELTPQTIQNSFSHIGVISPRLSDGVTVLEHQVPVSTFVPQHVSDLDMEKSLMATQSALITLQRDPRLVGSGLVEVNMSIDSLLDLEGEQNLSGWERMPSDEELVRESVFYSAQVIEEVKQRKRDEKATSAPHAPSHGNRSRSMNPERHTKKLAPSSTGLESSSSSPSRTVKLKPVGPIGNSGSSALHMVPLSVQETIQSFEQIEYSLPFYVNEEVIDGHLQHLQMLKHELRKALTGPGV